MTGRGQLLRELEWISKNAARILTIPRAADLDFRPREDMRTLRELGHHLAQIPSVDMAIMRGLKEEEVTAEEDKLAARAETEGLPNGWRSVLRDGSKDLARFMEQLSSAEYETGSGTAYFGRTQTYSQWLLETVTHLYHHRSQFFTYLKLLGYDVGTRTLYD
jgi:uncharacterized damage-inducible protein DinB